MPTELRLDLDWNCAVYSTRGHTSQCCGVMSRFKSCVGWAWRGKPGALHLGVCVRVMVFSALCALGQSTTRGWGGPY